MIYNFGFKIIIIFLRATFCSQHSPTQSLSVFLARKFLQDPQNFQGNLMPTKFLTTERTDALHQKFLRSCAEREATPNASSRNLSATSKNPKKNSQSFSLAASSGHMIGTYGRIHRLFPELPEYSDWTNQSEKNRRKFSCHSALRRRRKKVFRGSLRYFQVLEIGVKSESLHAAKMQKPRIVLSARRRVLSFHLETSFWFPCSKYF